MKGIVTIHSTETNMDWEIKAPQTTIYLSIRYENGQIISTDIVIPLNHNPSHTEIMRNIKEYFKGDLVYGY